MQNSNKEKIVKKKEFDFRYIRDNKRNKKKCKREDKREVDWIS